MDIRATYSPEDNKLRLYPEGQRIDSILDDAEYAAFKRAGFKWAAKQECFVAPRWTPTAEDWLLELAGEIEDEDCSPVERSADRAERFEMYRGKRAGEAEVSADAFDRGPSAFGHQNERRAERQARRHDRKRLYACSQWSKAEYWQQRTAGVIAHALYRAEPAVRRSRILRLEAEQRKHEADRADYAKRYAGWQMVPTLDGADTPIPQENYQPWENKPDIISSRLAPTTKAARLAYALANSGNCWGEYQHPRKDDKQSLYSLLTDKDDPITPREAATLWLDNRTPPDDPASSEARWSEHYARRLEYEKAMLANEGGSAATAEMEPGGWIGKSQIHAVTRSPVTGLVVSVKIMARTGWHEDGPEKLKTANIQRLPKGAYRPPTDEERAAFAVATKERKAKEKAAKPKAAPLINPTDEDAEKLQAIWNEKARESHARNKRYGECPVSSVLRMTQAEYSQRSKGSYAKCETSDVSEKLETRKNYGSRSEGGRVTVFSVRTCSPSGSSFSACRRVVILTDKPQKPIPWDEVEKAKAKQPTADGLFHRLDDIYKALSVYDYGQTEEAKRLLDDARYVGWVWSSSQTQRGLTEAGVEAYKKYKEILEEGGRPTATGVMYSGLTCAQMELWT